MTTGAQLLGLGARNFNMLYEFAANISPARKWCSWWEITGNGDPAAVDFKNDNDFWYDLPANFDVLNACYRQWLWSRNDAYIEDPVFLNFYNHSLTSYITVWENHKNGLLGGRAKLGYMGIPTYDEGVDALIGADLIAAEYVAYCNYAQILRFKGQVARAVTFERKATQLRDLYNEKWWDPKTQSFYSYIALNGKFVTLNEVTPETELPLYFGLAENGEKAKSLLTKLERCVEDDQAVVRGVMGGVESMSYLPNIFYKYRLTDQAYRLLKILTNPELKRRSYPEVSFTVVGNIGSGLMGIHPMMGKQVIKTLPQLPGNAGDGVWAELRSVPVGENVISVRHVGNRESHLINERGPDLRWRASFRGRAGKLFVDERSVVPRTATSKEGGEVVWIDVLVRTGEEMRVHA